MFLKRKNIRAPLAAPSWVFPGTIAENCAFLSGKIDEVGLLFMESASALAYGPEDLPTSLAALPLAWHVHLPCDLDWRDPAGAAEICLALMSKADFLGPKKAVLHPPRTAPGEMPSSLMAPLEEFMLCWRSSGQKSRDILLENLPEHKPEDILEAAERLDASVCLDLAHYLLAGGRAETLPAGLMRRVRLLHLCAPDPGGRKGHHQPLAVLDETGRAAGAKMCREAEAGTVFMLELFNWTDFTNSLPMLKEWME